ncbi:unnamed protein product [Gordionus sp. m RMFG-2023]
MTVSTQLTPKVRPYCRGPFYPYFGSRTKLRARRAPLQVMEVGSLVSNLKTIIELMSWIGSDDNLRRFLLTLIEEKPEIPFSTLQQHCRSVYSGSITHRMPCPAIKMSCMANCNTTLSSYFLIVSDTASRYAKSGINYNLCFQLVFLYAISYLSHIYTYGLDIRGNWAVILSCPTCIKMYS